MDQDMTSAPKKYGDHTPLLLGSGSEDSFSEEQPVLYGSDQEGSTSPNTTGSINAPKQAVSNSKQDRPTTKFVYILTALAAIGGFLFGYDTGVVSGAMILLREHFHLNSVWQELVVSITVGVAALFALFGGFLNDRLGRKPTIVIASVVFTVGAVILAAALNKVMLIIGRFTLGIGIGLASMTVPMYIAESAPPQVRGRLVTLNNLFITGGQFIASCVDGIFSYNKENGWRYMLGIAAVPAIIQFFGFLALPESPRWLVSKGKEQNAREVLQRIRGSTDVEEELSEIKEGCDDHLMEETGGRPVILRILSTPHVRRALMVGCGLQMFQQICGINTVMYYSATIIAMSGVKSDSVAIWLAAVTAFVNFSFTIVGLWLVEKIGRRQLTLGSLIGTMLSLALLAVGFQITAHQAPPITDHPLPPLGYNQSACLSYSECNQCMTDTDCGFCYLGLATGPSNGSCVPAAEDNDGNVLATMAAFGECRNATRKNSVEWAYGYCPSSLAWVITVGLVLYLAFFAPGMGPMPWTINSEIYPLWARSTGIAVATATNWVFNLLISMTFLTLTEALTRQGAFWLYTSFALVGIIFVCLAVPETKGKTLEEVEMLFKRNHHS